MRSIEYFELLFLAHVHSFGDSLTERGFASDEDITRRKRDWTR